MNITKTVEITPEDFGKYFSTLNREELISLINKYSPVGIEMDTSKLRISSKDVTYQGVAFHNLLKDDYWLGVFAKDNNPRFHILVNGNCLSGSLVEELKSLANREIEEQQLRKREKEAENKMKAERRRVAAIERAKRVLAEAGETL